MPPFLTLETLDTRECDKRHILPEPLKLILRARSVVWSELRKQRGVRMPESVRRYFSTSIPIFGILALVSIVIASGRAQQNGNKSQSARQSKTYERPTDASLYVGSETCKTCHEDMPSKGFYKTYEDSPHFATTLDTKKGPEWHGCEACHGPGKAHVDGGGDKTKIFTFKNASAKEISDRCLGCHTYGEEHSNYARSAHLQNNVSCIDCHNPHGGFLTRQVRATSSQDTVCFKCHSDKAGPFVYEHKAVKIEGCVACHTPHGSSNSRLLKRAQVNLLCLECHAFSADAGAPATPSFHNQAQKYQACTLCHTAIHGSNTDTFFFKP